MVLVYSWSLELEATLLQIHELKLKDELVATKEFAYCLPGEECLSAEQPS